MTSVRYARVCAAAVLVLLGLCLVLAAPTQAYADIKLKHREEVPREVTYAVSLVAAHDVGSETSVKGLCDYTGSAVTPKLVFEELIGYWPEDINASGTAIYEHVRTPLVEGVDYRIVKTERAYDVAQRGWNWWGGDEYAQANYEYRFEDAESAVAPGVYRISLEGMGAYTGSGEFVFRIAPFMRLAGDAALDTMSAIVKRGFSQADTVVVASADGYWDALSASSLAGVHGAPVVLTSGSELSPQAREQIKRLGATRALIVGGEFSVGKDVVKALEDMKCAVERVSGTDAVATAAQVACATAEQLPDGTASTCILATAGTFQDALSAGSYAYAKKAPIVLAKKGAMVSAETLSALKLVGCTRLIVVGGSYWIPDAVLEKLRAEGFSEVKRIAGGDAYDTSADFCTWALGEGMAAEGIGIACGGTYHDALAGAAFCGKNNSLLLLADTENTKNIDGFLSTLKDQASGGFVFGGEYWIDRNTFGMCCSPFLLSLGREFVLLKDLFAK